VCHWMDESLNSAGAIGAKVMNVTRGGYTKKHTTCNKR
jgi:hypothetical protein